MIGNGYLNVFILFTCSFVGTSVNCLLLEAVLDFFSYEKFDVYLSARPANWQLYFERVN